MKPLFIPLRKEFYEAFESGTKTTEIRLHGPRWNANTCAIGREVVLSRGYGAAHRLSGTIVGFDKVHGSSLTDEQQADLCRCFGTSELHVCLIHIQTRRPA